MARRVGAVRFVSTEISDSRRPRQKTAARSRSASVLLEVVLALSLFLLAATVITGGLNAAVQEVERLRLNVHASNLAISLLSELQMGIKPVDSAGPEIFEAPFQMWTWQIEVSSAEETAETGLPLRSVEVIVRHQTRPIVRRSRQFIIPPIAGATVSLSTNSPPAALEEPRSSGPRF